jgi:hypothetical protein
MDRFAFFYTITTSVPAPIVENAVFLPLDGFSSLVEEGSYVICEILEVQVQGSLHLS